MGRRVVSAMLCIATLGCGSWSRVGSSGQPSAEESLTRSLNTTQFYQRLGRLAADDPLPFVGTVAFAAGSGDSVIGILGLSLENRALTFQREGNVFVARYRVSLSFRREGAPSVDVAREEVVRVVNFQETLRSDESILFQQVLRLVPGEYKVAVTVRDAASTSESRAEASFTAPSFGAGSVSAPILVYQATGRGARSDPLTLVLNPRGSVGYGTDTLLAYIEGYGFSKNTDVPFKVVDEQQHVIHQDELRFHGGKEVESQVVRLSPDSVSLGELRLVVGEGTAERDVSALVSFTQAWVVTNFDEMLDLLRYFGYDEQVSAMRKAPVSERARLWHEFYTSTDPNTVTPENEALNLYFSRIAQANARFTDEGMPGWRTDRGEVYINLGPPDEAIENSPGTTANRIVRWTYLSYRLEIFFRDESGFGRLKLVPSSRSEYERTAARVRRSGS
jgi:GWxTD domain-containing protein